jgi:hypothetical protein
MGRVVRVDDFYLAFYIYTEAKTGMVKYDLISQACQ